MKYSKETLEQAIDKIIPSYSSMSAQLGFPIEETLKLVAIEIFMISDTDAYKLDYTKRVATQLIREALSELKENGSISYGDFTNMFN